MSMDLGHAGVEFENKTKDPKYIRFNSEVAIRKGDKGGVINSRLDNGSNWSTLFEYMLTSYKYKENQGKKEGESKLGKDSATMITGTYPGKAREKGEVKINNKKLVIKTPQSYGGNSDEWISPGGNVITNSKHLGTKHGSGAGIHDEAENSGIFQDIELYIEKKGYSQVFCKEEEGECRQDSKGNNNEKTKSPKSLETGSKATTESQTNVSEKVQSMVTSTIHSIIEELKDLRGKWVDLDEVCGVTKNRNLNDDQKNKLKMFCVNKKN